MKKLFALLLAMLLVLTCACAMAEIDPALIAAAQEEGELIVYGSCEEPYLAAAAKHFEELYGIKVYYQRLSTGEVQAKINEEAGNPSGDVWFGGTTDPYNESAKAGLLMAYEAKNAADLAGDMYRDADGYWYGIYKGILGFMVNTEELERLGLEAPKGWDDLLKPEYKGLVAMPDPKSSGTGYFFYKNWVNNWGDEKTLEYVDKLYPNLKQFTESGSGPIKLLKQGEIAVGLALTFQGISEINDGQPFEIIFPQEGSPFSLTGTAVVKGHENKKGVDEVFDFIINEFLVYDKEYFCPETIYEGQKNYIENYPQDIPYADMDGIQDYAAKERLLSLWKY